MNSIIQALSRASIRFGTELDMQADVATVLQHAQVPFVPEHRLNARSRIDFLCGNIGIECKIDGSPHAVLRQCMRYLEFESIHGLILVTSKPRHRWAHTELCGKPFAVVCVAGKML